MTFKPPLTHSELQTIRERQPWNSDVITLLWEVKRMRSELLRWHQVSNDLKRPTGLIGDIYDELLARLAAEPCVRERDDIVDALIQTPAKLRKGMAPR
ncbi:hypothetical protein [Achromobacter animicus]|uniref:hypothetical protein n=1 Tax=Achromobacter animicus TaxID=1389935 RepID=UPI0028ACA908|nr:hypothetical protein [Achromobacter animicus]